MMKMKRMTRMMHPSNMILLKMPTILAEMITIRILKKISEREIKKGAVALWRDSPLSCFRPALQQGHEMALF